MQDGAPRRGDQPLAHRQTHRAAHEVEVERRDHRRIPADPALGQRHRIAAAAESGLALAQPLGIALPIAEAERIGRDLREFELLEHALIEQHLESRLAADSEMMPAMAAHLQIGRQLAMKQHLLATRAFLPQIVGHVLAGEGPDLRQDVIGQPVHRDA